MIFSFGDSFHKWLFWMYGSFFFLLLFLFLYIVFYLLFWFFNLFFYLFFYLYPSFHNSTCSRKWPYAYILLNPFGLLAMFHILGLTNYMSRSFSKILWWMSLCLILKSRMLGFTSPIPIVNSDILTSSSKILRDLLNNNYLIGNSSGVTKDKKRILIRDNGQFPDSYSLLNITN